MAFRQSALTSDSFKGSHLFSCSICLSRSDIFLCLSLDSLSLSRYPLPSSHGRTGEERERRIWNLSLAPLHLEIFTSHRDKCTFILALVFFDLSSTVVVHGSLPFCGLSFFLFWLRSFSNSRYRPHILGVFFSFSLLVELVFPFWKNYTMA